MSIIPFPAPGETPPPRRLPGLPSARRIKTLQEIAATFSAPAPPPPPPIAVVELSRSEIIRRGNAAMKELTGFIGPSQAATVKSYLKGEEGQWFMEKMEELAAIVKSMPVTYGQDGKGDDAICYLHYFGPNYDCWITEKDMEESENPAEAQWQAHGYTHWAHNGQHVSMGYICLPEIFRAGAELDFHFAPRPLREIKRKLGIEVTDPTPPVTPPPSNSDPRPHLASPTDRIFGSWQILSEQIPHGAILFCKLGDFWETFSHHAEIAAPILHVAITKRQGLPLCGIPVHAEETFFRCLLHANYPVILAETDAAGIWRIQRTLTPLSQQSEDPILTRQKTFLAMEDGYQPGAIISYQWGYEQTNYNYYRIEKRTGHFVTLTPILSRSTPTGDTHTDEFPTDTPKDYAKDHDPVWGNKDLANPKPTFRRKLSILDGKPAGLSITGGSGWARLWEGRVGKATHYA
jgi:hypothetical protein